MGVVASVLRLTRIEHSAMLIIAILSAEILAGGLPGIKLIAFSLVTGVFLSMSAFAINDYFDVDVDRANGRDRPLVKGSLNSDTALFVAVGSMLIGIASSLFINTYCILIAIIFGTLSILYSYKLKEMPLIGNAYVALAMAIPFIFGDYVVSSQIATSIIIVFFLVFLSGLAREIDGTVRDYKGDSRRGARTLPMVIGKSQSAYIALALYIAAVILSVYLFTNVMPFLGNLLYAVLIAVSDIMILYSGMIFVLGISNRYERVRKISLASMALALVCIFASTLAYI
ncbi:MAG: UbiA family prenyltransferase [Candidatus Micrarchaeaceae archaeon]